VSLYPKKPDTRIVQRAKSQTECRFLR